MTMINNLTAPCPNICSVPGFSGHMSNLSSRSCSDFIQNANQPSHLLRVEYSLDALRAEIREWRLIQLCSAHPAALCQVVDHQIHELNLICGQSSSRQGIRRRLVWLLPGPGQPFDAQTAPTQLPERTLLRSSGVPAPASISIFSKASRSCLAQRLVERSL